MQSADELGRANEALRERIARTRADLETLVEASPAGVAVVEARTGRLVSFNREAARIVEGLSRPGQHSRRVIEALQCRSADGRELALAELPPSPSPPPGTAAARAEEMVLSVPGGGEVRALVGATPVPGGDGDVEWVVVTLQDTAPVEKLDRLRAEFLDMVSRELRTPLTSIKGSTAAVLGAPADLGPDEMLQFFRIIDEQAERLRSLAGALLDAGRTQTGALLDAGRTETGAATGPAAPAAGRGGARIVVAHDDPETRRYVRDALASAGYAPPATGAPDALPELLKTGKPRLVLLDLAPPGADGIELMRRGGGLADVPVIFISGYGHDGAVARALELGAADCIVKPFSPAELAARVQAALRRVAERAPYRRGDLAIDYGLHRVTVAGRPVDLTATEYRLLQVLSTGAGRVSTVDALLRQVWDGRRAGDPKLLRAFVKRLRRKLGDDAADPAYIFTERGVGYRMAASGDPGKPPPP